MKILISLFIVYAICFGCEGDCYKCHPVLKNSKTKEHEVIVKCVDCHKNRLGKQPTSEPCGTDCFECHQVDKISTNVKEHKEIYGCIYCHNVGKTPSLNLYDKPMFLRDMIGK